MVRSSCSYQNWLMDNCADYRKSVEENRKKHGNDNGICCQDKITKKKMPPQWRPIETAPKDETEILIYEDGTCYIGNFRIFYSHEGRVFTSGFVTRENLILDDPTYWMRLPNLDQEILS